VDIVQHTGSLALNILERKEKMETQSNAIFAKSKLEDQTAF
jgi:hypothetical protein